jgi:uncharacterized protein (DUF362 family)/Pyruvate/2-oxoacid:ferredoxin oxidoreductase delta subunit
MSTVFSKRATYHYPSLKRHLFEMLESIGGGEIEKGCRVIIKPNLLGPAPPSRAMLTHPLVVKGVAEYVLDRGGRVQVSDSPAMGTFEKVLKESGIQEALQGLEVTFREFKESVVLEVGEPFRHLEIAREAIEADVVINLPKLKTHSQMLLTLGVKNLFGCIVGLRKPQWHLRAGVDRELFAALLVRVYQAVKPKFTILDGILAMEGEGPGKGGRPKELGILLGSADAVALDVVVCRLLGLDEEVLLTNRAARQCELLDGPVAMVGDPVAIADFKLPAMTPLVFGPQFTHAFMRKHLIQRPEVEAMRCKSCGDCERYCPARAISTRQKKITFDYEKCIRCYCCLEVCPHGALKTRQPVLGQLFTRVINRSSG